MALGVVALVGSAGAVTPSWTSAPGRVTVSLDTRHPSAEGIGNLAALPDGAILAAARVGRDDAAVLRFLPDGRLDAAYGRRGAARLGGSGDPRLVARPDGATTVLTPSGEDEGDPPALHQLDPSGRPDGAFGGGDGRRVLPIERALSVAATPDGGTVVAGSTKNADDIDGRFAVARVRANGTLDATFGRRGVATTFHRITGAALAVAVQRDGRIVALGELGNPPQRRRVLVRLTAAGELDRSFGEGDGFVDLRWSDPLYAPERLLLDAQDRTVLIGSVNDRVRMARYTPAGMPDASFGGIGQGEQSTPPGASWIVADTDADALILALEYEAAAWLWRVTEQGQVGAKVPLTLPFGGGTVNTAYTSGMTNTATLQGKGETGFLPRALALRPDGSLILGGWAGIDVGRDIGASEVALAALRPDGRTEEGFGGPRRRPLRAPILRGRPKVVYLGGLLVRVAPRQRGIARVRVRADGRTIARGVIPLLAARPTAEVLSLTNAGKRLARRRPRARVTIRLTVSDLAGNRARASYRTTAALSRRRR